MAKNSRGSPSFGSKYLGWHPNTFAQEELPLCMQRCWCQFWTFTLSAVDLEGWYSLQSSGECTLKDATEGVTKSGPSLALRKGNLGRSVRINKVADAFDL